MIAFCTHCWKEINAAATKCAYCDADLTTDARTYSEKLLAALEHPLPDVRERVCWLIGENRMRGAIPRLVEVSERDSDLFVRREAQMALAIVRRDHTPK